MRYYLVYPHGKEAEIVEGEFGFGERCPNKVPGEERKSLSRLQDNYGEFILRDDGVLLIKETFQNLLRVNNVDFGLHKKIESGDKISLLDGLGNSLDILVWREGEVR